MDETLFSLFESRRLKVRFNGHNCPVRSLSLDEESGDVVIEFAEPEKVVLPDVYLTRDLPAVKQ